MSGPIRSVLIAGGGIVGWSAAAALRRKLPQIEVTLLACAPSAGALAEIVPSTLPSITGFHEDIGLSEADTVARVGSAIRLGTRFVGWTGAASSYVHAYSPYGAPLGTTSFHHLWLREAAEGSPAPFDAFSAAAALAGAGRFAPAQGDPLDAVQHGLELNLPRYRELLRAYGRHLGARERPGEIAEVRLRGDTGFIDTVALADGQALGADLFIDCTGPAARLRGRLDEAFDSWSRWLPCDRLFLGEAPPPAEPPLLGLVEAVAAGWRWEAASPARTTIGLCWASGHLAEAEAASLVGGGGEAIAIRQGRRPSPWAKNCVAVGDAAVAVEPLEWTNLHLAHSAIDRIVELMPGRDCAAIELTEYNRQAGAEADRVRDFLALHYLASGRAEDFWREAAAASPPPSLAHTLGLYRERGRLPFYEEETFTRDSWLAVLIGQGIRPRRIDPLVDAIPREAAAETMARLRESTAALAASLPTHAAYLENLRSRPAR
jgi:tryptophan halogenase